MLKYINNQSVAIVNFLADGGSPYTCNNWGDAGISNFPIILSSYFLQDVDVIWVNQTIKIIGISSLELSIFHIVRQFSDL